MKLFTLVVIRWSTQKPAVGLTWSTISCQGGIVSICNFLLSSRFIHPVSSFLIFLLEILLFSGELAARSSVFPLFMQLSLFTLQLSLFVLNFLNSRRCCSSWNLSRRYSTLGCTILSFLEGSLLFGSARFSSWQYFTRSSSVASLCRVLSFSVKHFALPWLDISAKPFAFAVVAS
jgi:hypothetical protein